jgi:NTE family protein
MPNLFATSRSSSRPRRAKFIVLSLVIMQLALSSTSVSKAFADEVLVPSAQVNATDVNKFKASQLPARPKIGLALGGGGARGAAEIGALEVLDREGLRFDYIAGTSIGSIIGGLYDAGVPLSKLHEEFASGRCMRRFLPIGLPQSLLLEPFMLSPRLLGIKSYDGLYPGVFFRKYLENLVPADAPEIQGLKTPYAAVSFNLIDGKPYMIRGGSLAKAMRASSAVPGLRKPVVFGENLMVDGGVACNLPVKQCREMGADIVIAINIDEPLNQSELKQFRKLGSVTKRMVKWDLSSIDGPQEEIADIVIHPDTSGVSLVTASREEAVKAIDAGKVAAEAALPRIREKLKEAGAVVQGKQLGHQSDEPIPQSE